MDDCEAIARRVPPEGGSNGRRSTQMEKMSWLIRKLAHWITQSLMSNIQSHFICVHLRPSVVHFNPT